MLKLFWYEKTKLVPTENNVSSKTGKKWQHNLQRLLQWQQ
jgi:hypothetical protein